jgi:hypothetical protein
MVAATPRQWYACCNAGYEAPERPSSAFQRAAAAGCRRLAGRLILLFARALQQAARARAVGRNLTPAGSLA